jgi:hypothetical protein
MPEFTLYHLKIIVGQARDAGNPYGIAFTGE